MKLTSTTLHELKQSCTRLSLGAFLSLLLIMASAQTILAQTAPTLGTAQSFAVLGGSTVTNTGPTIVTGNLGVSPGSAVTGFPPGTVVGGTIHAADAVAAQAEAANRTAYGELASEACNTTYGVPTDLGGLTLVPGVYCFASSAGLTGTLTLNAGGNANAVWVFKIASTLITASDASVALINGAQQCNVFWQVGSSATLGTGTEFVGNVLALASITLTTDATLSGRALAQNGAVTMDSNKVSATACSVPVTPVAPTIGKSFTPPTILAGGVSNVTITLSNANANAATLSSPLVDTLPKGVVISGNPTTTCGGSVTAPSGGSSITLTGGSIPAEGSCTISVNVKAPNQGSFINSIAVGALKTSEGSNASPAVSTLTVNAPASVAPGLGKTFSPSNITAGGVTSVVLTLSNGNADTASITAPLIDHLPTGVVVDGYASTTCNGAVTANNGSSTITLTGGSIPAESSCTVTVPVTAAVAGNYYNSLAAGALQTSNGANTSPAVATLTVSPVKAPCAPPTLTKSFSSNSIKNGGTTTLTINLNNSAAISASLTAPLTDQLPSGMVVSGTATTTCGGTVSAIWGGSQVTQTGGVIPARGSCKVTVTVALTRVCNNLTNTIPAGALKTSNGNNPSAAVAQVSAH
jgi:Ice-binding-like